MPTATNGQTPTRTPNIDRVLLDPSVAPEVRRELLKQVVGASLQEPERARAQQVDGVLDAILQAAVASSAEKIYLQKQQEADEKKKEFERRLNELRSAPLRGATFVGRVTAPGKGARAKVRFGDGGSSVCPIPEPELARALARGDTVWLDNQSGAVLFRDEDSAEVGEEARLERWIDAERVEVEFGARGRSVLFASQRLLEQRTRAQAEPGSKVLACAQRLIAFATLPPQDGLGHFQFLCRVEPPAVSIERDIGSPKSFLGELAEHVRIELEAPELHRRYRLPRCRTHLLAGVSGSGKTLSILGLWRRVYEVTSEVTGVALADLPPRVFRLRTSQVLSMYLGESDKQIDRFFDEVEELAGTPWTAPDGRALRLPVLVICEEIDAMARERGRDHDGVHDRIQNVLLQRLDRTAQAGRDPLVLYLFTTNVLQLCDPAFLRRAGDNVTYFGRLARSDFASVLAKHLDCVPVQQRAGEDEHAARRRMQAELDAWLYAPNGPDRGQAEITYVGAAAPALVYRRDFLTGSLVQRAVTAAAARACSEERAGHPEPGVTSALLEAALDRQVVAIVDQLQPLNAHNYLTLEAGKRVGTVRPLLRSRLPAADPERRAPRT